MSTPAPRRLRQALAAASLVIAVPVLGGCGFGIQSDQVYQPSVGVNDRSGTVDVLGAVVVSGLDGQGTLVASLVNKSKSTADTLISVTPTDTSSGVTTRLESPIEVAPASLVNLADKGAVSVTGSSITAGKFVELQLKFSSGQQVDMDLPIVDQSGYYADIEPANPSPTATPSP